MHSDDAMMGPGIHEDQAQNHANNGRTDAAMVEAVLALASAVNRLADAHRDLVSRH